MDEILGQNFIGMYRDGLQYDIVKMFFSETNTAKLDVKMLDSLHKKDPRPLYANPRYVPRSPLHTSHRYQERCPGFLRDLWICGYMCFQDTKDGKRHRKWRIWIRVELNPYHTHHQLIEAQEQAQITRPTPATIHVCNSHPVTCHACNQRALGPNPYGQPCSLQRLRPMTRDL